MSQLSLFTRFDVKTILRPSGLKEGWSSGAFSPWGVKSLLPFANSVRRRWALPSLKLMKIPPLLPLNGLMSKALLQAISFGASTLPPPPPGGGGELGGGEQSGSLTPEQPARSAPPPGVAARAGPAGAPRARLAAIAKIQKERLRIDTSVRNRRE